MEQNRRPRGRPKKLDTDGTPEQVKKRQYMRNYVSGIKKGIVQLEQDELDCLKDLQRMRDEKSKLINMLDDANKQAGDILTEKTKTPVKKMTRPANISLPKPKPTRSYAKK
jgi:soluble cytochrome b562